jgi:hypothetical protein
MAAAEEECSGEADAVQGQRRSSRQRRKRDLQDFVTEEAAAANGDENVEELFADIDEAIEGATGGAEAAAAGAAAADSAVSASTEAAAAPAAAAAAAAPKGRKAAGAAGTCKRARTESGKMKARMQEMEMFVPDD